MKRGKVNMISAVIDALRDIVENKLGKNLTIRSAVRIDQYTYRLYLDDTLWLRVNDNIFLQNSESAAHVKTVTCDYIEIDFIETEGTPNPAGKINLLPEIKFFHGTIRNVSGEMIGIGDSSQIPIIIYYVEVSSSDLDLDPTAAIDSVNNARLLILKECDNSNWLTKEHYDKVIRITEEITQELIEEFRKIGSGFGTLSTGTVSNHVRAGTYSDKGTEKNVFANFFYSGCDLRINLPLLKKNCNC